ncbi:MAG TPA: DinB family protein [Bacillota bacterium]
MDGCALTTQWFCGRLHKFLVETRPVIAAFEGAEIDQAPVPGVRSVGDLLLHLVRSIAHYANGIAADHWAPLPYSLAEYRTVGAIIDLYDRVGEAARKSLSNLPDLEWSRIVSPNGTASTKAELLFELIEHGVHHRGQLYSYARLLGVAPPPLPYAV